MSNKKRNQFIKTYKIDVSFKLNRADFPPLLNSTVYMPVFSVSSSLSFTTAAKCFLNKVRAISFKSLTKASNKLFLGPLAFVLETFLLSIYTILPNHLSLILLVTFQLNSNITLFVILSCPLNPLLLM